MTVTNSKIFFVVFLCSFSSLAYQITLTRIFSISLWYHFAFMIISIAMLGYGASGTVLSLYPKLKEQTNIKIYSIFLSIGISLSYLISNQIPFDPVRLSWEKTQLLYIALYYVVLSAPFFFTGLIIAAAFSSISEKSGLLYGSDLLGAGAGSIGILAAMTVTEPERAVFMLAIPALIASVMISGNKLKVLSIVLILSNLSLIFFKPAFINLRMSQYKGLEMALRFPGAEHLKTYFSPFSRIDTFKSPAVRFAPGLSLRYLEPLPEQTGIAIDGGEINAITEAGDDKSLSFLGYLPSALPYEIGKKGAVVILDPKGGLQALVARYYNSKNIYKIELNSLLIRVIKDEFSRFSGRMYEQETWSGLGRSRLKVWDEKFNIIDISLMGAAPVGSFGISEDYRFTVEAFVEYINHLKPDGFLSINLYLLPPPRIELRLLNTVIEALDELRITGMRNQVAAIRSWDSICILIKKSHFTAEEINTIKRFSKDRRFDLIYYPGISKGEGNRYIKMPSDEYYTAFENLLDIKKRSWFTENYLFDIKPVRDDNPFFHQYLKIKNIREIYKVMDEKWQYFMEEGYVLQALFLQVMILSLALIFLPILRRREGIQTALSSSKKFLPYFAFLGIGYMVVEIALIQKAILPLENPSYAVAAVLASMLISSGIGSLLSHRFSLLRSPFVAGLIALLVIAFSLLIPRIFSIIAPLDIGIKISAVFFALIPLGFFMGIPFPMGLRILGERDVFLIPWAWAINACFSVLAPVLTVMTAMTFGFKIVLWFGALAYAVAFVMLSVFSGPRRS